MSTFCGVISMLMIAVCSSAVSGNEITSSYMVADDRELLPYDAKAFNCLMDVDIASQVQENEETGKIQEEQVFELGDIIMKNNMQNCVGVAVLHKHFELASNERMVFETIVLDDDDIVGDYMLHGRPVDDEEFTGMLQTKCCKPYLFKFDPIAHGWIPLQYICDNSTQCDASDCDFEELFSSKKNGWIESRLFLTTLNASNELGLFIRHSYFDKVSINNHVVMEESFIDGRNQYFKFVNKSDYKHEYEMNHVMNTHFSFDDAYKLKIRKRECIRLCYTSYPHRAGHSSRPSGPTPISLPSPMPNLA